MPLLGYHKEINAAGYSPRIECPTLILRATEGTLSPDDRVLPESAVERMLKEIPDAQFPLTVPIITRSYFTPTLPETTPSIISSID